MRIKLDGTGRQIIVNHEHSSETTVGTWVAGTLLFILISYIYINMYNFI